MSNRAVWYVGLSVITLVTFSFCTPCLANSYREVGNPIATIYAIEEHQSGSQVWWIDQLSDGQMVFATGNGLTTWDGENWQHASSPNNTRMRALTMFTDGNIYAGAVGQLGYFEKTATGEFSFIQLPTQHLIEQFGQTRSVNSNTEMVVYSTSECLFIWDGESLHKFDSINFRGARVFNIDGQLLIADSEKFYQISKHNDVFTAVAKPWALAPNSNIKSLFLNAKNELIMVTNMDGIYRLDNNIFTQVVDPTNLPISAFNSGIQGKDKYYYVNSTINGLLVFSESFELLRHYKQNDGLGLATTYHIFQDMHENIWLAGLPNISVFQPPHLRSQYRNNTATLDFENIYQINDTMYFSGTGFYQLTFPSQDYLAPVFTQTPNFDQVVLDMVGIDNALIVGTDEGVYHFEFDLQNSHLKAQNPKLISTRNFVSDLALAPNKDSVYVAIGSHFSNIQLNDGVWHETRLLEDKSEAEYVAVEPLGENEYALWVSSDSRDLYRLQKDASKQYQIQHFANADTPLGQEHILPFMFANELMIGTENGVYSYQAMSSERFVPAGQLPLSLLTPGKDVFKVLDDEQGRLWYHAGRDTGVVYSNKNNQLVAQESIFSPYNKSGTRGLAFFNHAIWFGVANGSVYRMAEDVIERIPNPAKVRIRYISSIDSSERLSIAIDAPAIPNHSNSIRIGYALSDFAGTTATLYRTKLTTGGKSNWTLWSNEANKDFTLLAGGSYTFTVEAKDPWGRVSQASHRFYIEYPWYLNNYALVCYAVVFLLMLLLSVKVGQRRHNKKLATQNAELEHKVKQRTTEIGQKVAELKDLHILKDRFFANVSHEFRTPLTLTIGPLQEAISKHRHSMGKESQQLTLTALSNAKKMLALVGQVLDVNRLEVGNMPLRVSEVDLARMLRTNVERFAPWAQQQSQTLECTDCEDPKLLFCDEDQIDKCISNLLSNAIKYSGPNSHITVSIVSLEGKIGIRIADDGVGLASDLQDKVFERFYQAKTPHNTLQQGSGIGLHLVKEIVLLHNGEVNLTSQVNKGCQFTLYLPSGSSHFTPEQLSEPMFLPQSTHQEVLAKYDSELDKATVLVVDDNPDLRLFISQCLSANYRIIEAQNGEQGIALALQYLPDVIVSDVTMPGLSGLALAEQLKSNAETRSIPILLLSAQTTKRDIVAGFTSGANDYLIKPFDTSELVMRINSLLNQYKDRAKHSPATQEHVAQSTDSFETKLNHIIDTHMSDNQFSVDALAKALFMSNETLRRKCKQSFNLSPSFYINLMRLSRSKVLLEQKELNVSEVAYAVGFDSLAYFSRCFKKQYGVSPSLI